MEDFRGCLDINEDSRYKHQRTVIHIDLDCFYAQVEMLKDPALSTKPLGIKQQHYVITSNYIAREYGIKKCMLISEALALCPKLIILNGEDLHDYRKMSSKVNEVIKQFSAKVEKLGMDENFVDVSDLVEIKLKDKALMNTVKGHIYRNELEMNCKCGCRERLTIGSHIAYEIRNKIKEELGLTCCAGVSHNKLLAKLVCSTHKPNQQTTVFPSSATSLVSCLTNVRAIPGVGRKTSDMLNALGIIAISDLQNYSLTQLERHFGKPLAMWIKGACFGKDDSDVKESGKQQTIGLEEATKMISTMEDVQKRISSLIERGLLLLEEDGRYPTTLRVTVRKYLSSEEYCRQRESKQCAINTSTFRSNLKEHIFETALGLFKKLVDCSKPFHLTLIGLAFTKFQDNLPVKSSILKFIEKKDSHKTLISSTETSGENKDQYIRSHSQSSKISVLTNSNMEKVDNTVLDELPSNSCAKVMPYHSEPESIPCSSTLLSSLHCPPEVDFDVFNQLPYEIQIELINESKNNSCKNSEHEHIPCSSASLYGALECPAGVDINTFNELPHEIQVELLNESKNKHDENKSQKPPLPKKQKSILSYIKKK